MAARTANERFDLITHNLQEVLSPEIIREVLDKNERSLKIYWGTATTGKPHCGYFVPMIKIAEFLAAGCTVKILIADVHGFLDNEKAPEALVGHRSKYYELTIREALRAVGVDLSRLQFVLGSTYQYTPKYMKDLLRIATKVSGHDSLKAGSDVVKQVENAPTASQIYPLMQVLDEEHLDVDAQFGGQDQRKIFTLALESLPRLGYAKRAHLMNPLIPGLQEGGKMSSSDPDSKIDLIDPPEVVQKKFKKAFCPPEKVEGNGVLSFVQYVLLPASALKNNGTPKFVVPRRDAEPLEYSDIKQIHEDYASGTLQPQTIKPAAVEALLELMGPIRKAFEESKEWQETEVLAYPPPPAPEKKKKKEKNLGSRFPGSIEAKPDGHIEGPGADEASVGISKLAVDDAGQTKAV